MGQPLLYLGLYTTKFLDFLLTLYRVPFLVLCLLYLQFTSLL